MPLSEGTEGALWMLGSEPSAGCLTAFCSPLLCPFAQAWLLFFAPPLLVTFPMQITRLANPAGWGALSPEASQQRVWGLLQGSPREQGRSVRLPGPPLPFRSPPFCPPCTLCPSLLCFSPLCSRCCLFFDNNSSK